MALLGHCARLWLRTPHLENLAEQLVTIGFDQTDPVVHGRMSDGQILLHVAHGELQPPALLYHAPSLQSVGDRLTSAGIAFEGSFADHLDLLGPGQLRVRVVPAAAADMEERSGEDNHDLGFLDAIVVPVNDVNEAATWAQRCGFFIIESSEVGMPMVDVTDGLVKMSFRKQELRAPYLHYTADIDEEWCEALKERCGASCVIHGDALVRDCVAQITLGDALTIMVTADEF